MPKNKNLDAVINELGYNIVDSICNHGNKDKDKLIRHIDKALGVLANDGVYAYYVFCKSKDKPGREQQPFTEIFVTNVIKKIGNYIDIKCRKEDNRTNNSKRDANEVFFEKLSEDLNNLLFFKELLERVLIYARYHAKAIGDSYE